MELPSLKTDSLIPFAEKKKEGLLAAVLTNYPGVLLLDESAAELDPKTQLWSIELLQELGGRAETSTVLRLK